ncbi:MAG: 50S ribosomal protein L24 [Myxococcales bacterium]|nr:50S ribosomal protein L24 [Myxococcales bacterium]
MQRLRVGDEVIVTSGNNKGRRGRIKQLRADRVVIEGVNLIKRHMKATPNQPGGILEVEAPIHASNVMLIDPETDKPTRVRAQVEDGKKVRVAVKSGKEIAEPVKS